MRASLSWLMSPHVGDVWERYYVLMDGLYLSNGRKPGEMCALFPSTPVVLWGAGFISFNTLKLKASRKRVKSESIEGLMIKNSERPVVSGS
jgi:hypothetical protein